MMRLEFIKRHLSINAFPQIDVPPLTIVVGVNGSGKTHLLQAIQNGSIRNSVAPVTVDGSPPMNEGPVRLLASTGTPIGDGSVYVSINGTAGHGLGMREESFESARRQALSQFSSELDTLTGGKISESLLEGEDIWRMGIDAAVTRGGNAALRMQIEAIFGRAEAELLKPLHLNMPRARMVRFSGESIQTAAVKLGISPLAVTEQQEKHLRPWQADQFQNNLPTLFGRYRDAWLRNRLGQLKDQDENSSNSMTNEEFAACFGEAPWKQISATFNAFRLPYEAAAPDLHSFDQVNLMLTKRPGGEVVSIGDLSSGERVLLQFAISSYQYDETIVNVRRPEVLLLDEMDAPLHPET